MRDNNTNLNLDTSAMQVDTPSNRPQDYSVLLKSYCLDYKCIGIYMQVGEPKNIQGWILHISVIPMQIEGMLREIIPILIKEGTAFKVVQNRDKAKELLYGSLGSQEIGKVIHIYPDDDSKALYIAKTLVQLTNPFRGPSIPNEINLGGSIYTRYEMFKPSFQFSANGDEGGNSDHPSGELENYYSTSPFQVPKGIKWPFKELASPVAVEPQKILHDIYKPLSILKSDTRGNVIKGIYLKSFFRIGNCVIKAGKKNMLVDDSGRDIQDRLMWQKELQEQLNGIIPLPKVIDLFRENGDMYLVMEFIKGKSLYNQLSEINTGYKTFFQLSISEQALLLSYLLEIVQIIEILHKKGYVHRDIAPGNFLLNHKKKIIVIDMELAYRLSEDKSIPPFELGTPGFMSPEQNSICIPTPKEDIYGLGSLMIFFFTTLSPIRFDTDDRDTLAENISFFIAHNGIANLICKCMDHDPLSRPELLYIRKILEDYRSKLTTEHPSNYQKLSQKKPNSPILKEIINLALEGLCKRPMPVSNGLWLSKTINTIDSNGISQKEYSTYAGLNIGMTGVLYLLARAKILGFNIEEANNLYDSSWKFIEKQYIKSESNLGAGIYSGKAGIALAMANGISAGILENNQIRRHQIYTCLDLHNETLGLMQGLSGQGMVLLQCSNLIGKDIAKVLLQGHIAIILEAQQNDGSWINQSNPMKKKTLSPGFSNGISGITWFLLEYYSRNPDNKIKVTIEKALVYILKRTNNGKVLFDPHSYRKLVEGGQEISDERTGFIMVFIKAYEILRNPNYMQIAESILVQYPEFVVNNNFSQDGGLAGLGEIYLEAWRVFRNNQWKERAEQIKNVFFHTIFRGVNGGCYWLTEEVTTPVADLMVGNSGIIHFLLRCQYPDHLGYILLN